MCRLICRRTSVVALRLKRRPKRFLYSVYSIEKVWQFEILLIDTPIVLVVSNWFTTTNNSVDKAIHAFRSNLGLYSKECCNFWIVNKSIKLSEFWKVVLATGETNFYENCNECRIEAQSRKREVLFFCAMKAVVCFIKVNQIFIRWIRDLRGRVQVKCKIQTVHSRNVFAWDFLRNKFGFLEILNIQSWYVFKLMAMDYCIWLCDFDKFLTIKSSRFFNAQCFAQLAPKRALLLFVLMKRRCCRS